jgi:hypothetical protein
MQPVWRRLAEASGRMAKMPPGDQPPHRHDSLARLVVLHASIRRIHFDGRPDSTAGRPRFVSVSPGQRRSRFIEYAPSRAAQPPCSGHCATATRRCTRPASLFLDNTGRVTSRPWPPPGFVPDERIRPWRPRACILPVAPSHARAFRTDSDLPVGAPKILFGYGQIP